MVRGIVRGTEMTDFELTRLKAIASNAGHRSEDEPLEWIGETHGCGCCSKYKPLTVVLLSEHIQSLRVQLKWCEDLLGSGDLK